ncbi:MAG TPA: glycoside hydrolase family 2 TIM barrel-domain containing protein, partial [Bryobacteraceae bacterium]|nr:glycoside hydrolase family 2 TIM barrel-domain containing protein [Bryobacteraceae bacterium]
MTKLVYLTLLLTTCLSLHAGPPAGARAWTVRVEEPTGIERRTGELVRVPLAKLGGYPAGFRVSAPGDTEVPVQVSGGELLFPVSLMGGQVAEYKVVCCSQTNSPAPRVTVRRMASGRIEMRNERVRLVVNPETAAIVEAYNLSAGPQRILNLVETTPDQRDPNDIHDTSQKVTGPALPVAGPNQGWTALGAATGEWKLTSGVLEGRLERGGFVLTLAAGSQSVIWTAPGGFRFASISALPHMPFDRCADGNEYDWPTGPGSGEPPNPEIGVKKWTTVPGGVFSYYNRSENYGALGIAALDESLQWTGACTSRFEGRSPKPISKIGLLFHDWRGDDTVLAARSEARKLRQPLLVTVEGATGPVAFAESLPNELAPVEEVAAALPPPFSPERLDLNGAWSLAWGEKGQGPSSEWRTVQVPGSVHLQWLPRDQVYERSVAWVSQKEWWYKLTIEVPAAMKGKRLRLEFGATDYFAEIFIDGHRIARHEGYIDPHGHDITEFAKAGSSHELKLRIWTPVHYYWKHRPYTVKGSYGGVDQKPDDITALGITRGVSLIAWQQARIEDLAVDTRIENGQGIVEIAAEADGELDGVRWEAYLSPANFSGGAVQRIAAPAVGNEKRFVFNVKDPRLWWTWDHGKQNLYTLDVRLQDAAGHVLSAKRIRVGIRTIARHGDKFYLNGKPVFIRGTNIYANLWMSEFGRKEYERDLAIIRKMNVNAIRSHCHFENPEFYELADEQGYLVWQDYLEAWYPHDTEFSRRAAELYDNHIRMVRNHPSIMAWAPSDEEDLENYRDLSKHLAARASLLDPQDRWVQRSTGRWGDAHLYYGWYGGSLYNYAKMTANLVTELGSTALPNRESIERFMKGKWPIPDFAEDWHYRRLQLPEAERAWGDLRKLTVDDAVEISQAYASRLFQIALERQRRRKEEGA